MKQIIQSFKTGETSLKGVPAVQVSRGICFTKNNPQSGIPGTERMLLEFGRADIIQKARQQPDKVKQVLDRITEGLVPTLEAVFNKLEQALPLG